jgi:hypothetical protein
VCVCARLCVSVCVYVCWGEVTLGSGKNLCKDMGMDIKGDEAVCLDRAWTAQEKEQRQTRAS